MMRIPAELGQHSGLTHFPAQKSFSLPCLYNIIPFMVYIYTIVKSAPAVVATWKV